jgi:hypothetical protein
LLLRTFRFPEIRTCETTDELGWVIFFSLNNSSFVNTLYIDTVNFLTLEKFYFDFILLIITSFSPQFKWGSFRCALVLVCKLSLVGERENLTKSLSCLRLVESLNCRRAWPFSRNNSERWGSVIKVGICICDPHTTGCFVGHYPQRSCLLFQKI